MIQRWIQVGVMAVTLAAMGMGTASADPRSDARRILQRFDSEPAIVDVQRQAMRYAQVNPGAYDTWLSASRWAYALPKNLRGRLRWTGSDKNDVRTTSAGSGSLSDLVSKDNQALYEVQADWDLTRLVFNRDQVTAARQIERIVSQREDLLTTVNKIYFARRQIQVDLEIDPPAAIDKAVRNQLRVDALTADLDALTGGWFSKQLPKAAP